MYCWRQNICQNLLFFYGCAELKVPVACAPFLHGDQKMTKPFVAILMGSDSDLPVMEASFKILKKFDIPFEVKVTSAHRTPAATHSYVTDADARGCAAFICAAGMAAHLAGAVSATTLRPVIGVPINGSLDGLGRTAVNSTDAWRNSSCNCCYR